METLADTRSSLRMATFELVDDFADFGQKVGADEVLDHQRICQVVDVFGCAQEMDVLAKIGASEFAEAGLEKVLDSFDVMIRCFLDFFDLGVEISR